MNTGKTKRRTIRTGLGTKNKFTQNRLQKRINNTCKNRPKRRYFPKFRKNRLQSVQNVLGYNRNFETQDLILISTAFLRLLNQTISHL